ncbi:MAG: AI-2E family transporter [Candidatus Nanohalobium sp.]
MEIDRQKAFLYGSTVLVALICFIMISSLISYLLTGLLLAFVTYPAFRKIRSRFGKDVSAVLVIALTIFAAILPFTIIIGAVGGDAARMVSGINTSQGLQAADQIDHLVMQYTGQSIHIERRAGELVKNIASFLPSGLSSAVSLFTDLSIGVSLMLFLQFYALKDGRQFVEWTKKFDFMNDERQDMLYSSTAESVWAVVKGHVLVAFSQGVLAGIGLLIAGVPNVLFWTFVMVLLGFIPMIGSAFVWFPAAVYLAITGNLLAAGFLVAYGVILVGGSDNFLRPLVVDSDADIHPFFILLGLIGGIGLFGPVGIFLGPVIFGILKNLLDMIIEKQ